MARNRKEQIKKNLGQRKGKNPGHTSLTEPLNPKQARHMAGAQARSEYAPTIRAAKQEAAGSQARQKQIGEWFAGLQNQIGQAAQATDASYAQANNALLAHAQAAQKAAEGAQSQVAGFNAQEIARTGADPSLFAPSMAEGAAAAGQRAMTNQALAAPIAAAGASQSSYLRNTGLNAGRESIQQRMLESKRRQKIREDINALRKERSQKAVGNFRDIRNEERDYGIQRAAFKLDKLQAGQDAAEGAADRSLEEAKFSETRRHNQATEANARADNGSHGMTPSEKRDARQGRRNAMVTVENLYTAAKKPPQTEQEWAGFTQLVAQEEEISPAEARQAVKKFRERVAAQGVGQSWSEMGF